MEELDSTSFWGSGGRLYAQLHGTHGQGHHHLAMVVVEMRLVLKWMTDDGYGSSGTGEGRYFVRVFVELNEEGAEEGLFFLAVEGVREEELVRDKLERTPSALSSMLIFNDTFFYSEYHSPERSCLIYLALLHLCCGFLLCFVNLALKN